MNVHIRSRPFKCRADVKCGNYFHIILIFFSCSTHPATNSETMNREILANQKTVAAAPVGHIITVFPHIRPAGIIILHSLQMHVLLENTTFLLHKIIRIAGIIRVAGIIRGRILYEEIRYSPPQIFRPSAIPVF